MEPENLEVFPNLQWLPTTSVEPRKEHETYNYRIWAKTDSFWNINLPPQEWGCKCSVRQTDEPATENSNIPVIPPTPGLEGNPFYTGEIFTENASYFKNINEDDIKIINSFYVKNDINRLLEQYNGDGKISNKNNLTTGKFLNSNKAYERLVNHCYSIEQIQAASVLPYHIKNLKNPKSEKLAARKDMNLDKNQKNIEGKKKRGITEYITYDFNIFNKNFTVFLEKHENGFEQLYAVYKKKT